MFTFKKTKNNYAIAKIKDGEYDNSILYLDESKISKSATQAAPKKKRGLGLTYCEYCDKNYSDPSTLTRHQKYHCAHKGIGDVFREIVKKQFDLDDDDIELDDNEIKTLLKNKKGGKKSK